MELTDNNLIELISERLDSYRRARNDLMSVTDKLVQMNQKLQESEALKSHFLSNIRNEINNPLTAIMGLAKQLLGGGVDPQLTASLGEMIYFEAFNLDFQMQNILVAAELEAGDAVPSFAYSDITSLVRGVADSLSHLATRKKIAVTVDVPADFQFVTDAQKAHLVVLNLLMNALEFSPEGSSVIVAAGRDRQFLKISVRDQGVGIDPQDQAEIFDRFRQLDRGACKSHPGHGLGLSVARSLADLLGGSIELTSAPGKGSEFTLSLPEAVPQSDVLAQDGNLFFFEPTTESF